MRLDNTTLALFALTTCVFALKPRQDPQTSVGSSATGSSAAASSVAASSAAASATPSGTAAVGDLDQSVNISIDGTIFPPPISAFGITKPQDITVNCVNCSIIGEISVTGGGGYGDDIIYPPAPFPRYSEFDFNATWVGAAIHNMTAYFEFAINLTASNNTNEFIVPLYSITKSRTFDKVMTVTATFTPEIHGWVNTTNDVNFTHGFEIFFSNEQAQGSGVLISIGRPSQWAVFDGNSSIATLPFTSTKGDIEMSLELSFRPQFIFTVDFPDQTASVDVATYFDIPKLDVQVTQVHNVSSTCDPAPSSLAADQIFRNLTNLISSVGVDASFAFGEKVDGNTLDQPPEFSGILFNLSTACLAFNPVAKTLGPAAQAEPSIINASVGTKMEAYNSAAGMLLAVVTVVFATF